MTSRVCIIIKDQTNINFSSRKLFKTKMVVRMISGNITIPHPHPIPPPCGVVRDSYIFPEIIQNCCFGLSELLLGIRDMQFGAK